MALKVKRLLTEAGISQRELSRQITQTAGPRAGQPLGASAVAQLLNHGVWPRLTNRDYLKELIRGLLRANGIAADAMTDLWTMENEGDRDPRKRASTPATNGAERGRGANTDPVARLLELPEQTMLSQHARKHFGINVDPFVDDVRCSTDVFFGEEQRHIRQDMLHAAMHGGFLAVIGESGAGKTVLRKDLIERINRENLSLRLIQPRTIDKARLTAHAIADAIILDCSVDQPKGTLEAKGRQVERVLTESSRAGVQHALLIEEAHDLTIPTLKLLKRYWELEDGLRRLLSIVLLGQPELHTRLDERVNWEAREVIRRCEIAVLEPLARYVPDYLALKFRRIGVDPARVFAADAYDALRGRLTVRAANSKSEVDMTYPLVVNNTTKRAMNLAADQGSIVNAEIVGAI